MMASEDDILGFEPQKELPYSNLLPYADKLNDDSKLQLAEIKTNTGRAVILKDFRPGCLFWLHRLSDYICLYGRKFSKEDHIAFIKVYYDLVVTPDTEFSIVQTYANILIPLLKKRELLSPDDLQLPWRPLYLLYESLAYSQYDVHGLILLPGRNASAENVSIISMIQELSLQQKWTSVMANLEGERSILTTIKSLIRLCRPYFPLSATQEMLDEWLPLMCPFDVTVLKATSYFELFLPTLLPPEHHDKGFKLWFKKIVDFWQMANSCPSWENSVVWLLSRLAMDTIGYIDWEPFMPIIFTKLLRSFNLPVGSYQIQIGRSGNGFEVASAVNFITAMMGGGTSCLKHVAQLFKAIESYYHPSNHGRWNMKLSRLLYKLPAAVVNRLHKERFKKSTWEPTIPASHCLTDEDVSQFVESIKPCALLAMFSKTGSLYSASALQFLAIMRPEMIVPSLLERLYPAMETLTEPHRLIATMHCFVSVSRSLVHGGSFYPEGPAHVIPLLFCSLPGIDPNDFKKCMVTFQFIFAFVTLVPIVDCSSAVNYDHLELTERERDLCLATRELEDFVLQFMDRCFALIENSTLEHTTRLDRDTEKMNSEEGMLEVVLTSTFTAMLMQCSSSIYQSALTKLQSFISGRVLETKVAGKLAANMCRAASKVNSELALKTFLPHLIRTILNLTTSEEVLKEEMLDTELLFSLLLLSEIVRCDGKDLLLYKEDLAQVMKRTLKLTSKPGYLLAHSVLRHILKALTMIAVQEFRSTTQDYNQSMADYLPIRDWGKSGDVYDLDLKWHVPTEEEKEWAQELLFTFLVPELQKLERIADGKETVTREQLQQCLSVVIDIILGAGGLFPVVDDDPINLEFSSQGVVSLNFTQHTYTTSPKGLTLEGGACVRKEIARVIHKLLEFMLSTAEDDTKSLFQIIQIYQHLIFYLGVIKEDFEARWKSFHFAKKAMENKLLGKKQHIRSLLVDRAQMQHEMCILEQLPSNYTTFHDHIMNNLLLLATSHYSEVRSRAQLILNKGFGLFTYSYARFTKKLVALVKDDPSITHEQFKGALHVILGLKTRSFLNKHNWPTLIDLWPNLIQAQHSEKPSIIKLMDSICEHTQKHLETIVIKWNAIGNYGETAKLLWNDSLPECIAAIPSSSEVDAYNDVIMKRNDDNLRMYHELVQTLVDLINSGNLRWRHYHMALTMLSLLIRHDILLPAPAVKLFVQNLIHETLSVRKLSISAVAAILKQQKRKHVKVEVDPFAIKEDGTVDPNHKCNPAEEKFIKPGTRKDNEWVQYHSKYRPLKQENWESRIFINKTHWGFYSWPKPLLVYAPYNQQPKLERTKDEMNESEAELYEFFSQENKVNKWISFLSLEDRKGRDKFDAKRFTLFKGLFRNFGITFLPLFRPHLERLVADSQESSQRCSSEIIAGLIRGSKHWPFHMAIEMHEILRPILKTALTKITVETVGDWGTCIATASESGDPNRLHWLLELLIEEPMRTDEVSFIESSRLYVLQSGFSQQEWRIFELLHRLLDYLKPYLTHPFQNVRIRLGGVLTNIFMMDIKMDNDFPNGIKCPQRSRFIAELLPQLSILESEVNDDSAVSVKEKLSVDGVTSSGDVLQIPNITSNCCESAEKKTALALMKTVCKWIIGHVTRSLYSVPPELFNFLPLLCQLESNDNDEELKQDCMLTLSCLGQAFLNPSDIPVAINTVIQISKSASWRARASSLTYLQLMVFCNIFSIKQNSEWVTKVRQIILSLLEDERLEVREMAGITLGGFLHCKFFEFTTELLNIFKSKCSKKLAVGRNRQGPISSEAVIQRHAGVLGLCSYVNAFPYDVPEQIPDILMLLGDHLNDPQPIPLTIKKTLSNFRRTHHDNWRDHKLKFSDDQLAVLTDLLVSPSYYA